MLDFDDLLNKIPRKQDFSTIRSSQQIYVDKTAIIYKIVNNDDFYFLSRPRRFGKSTIVSILKELFTHGVKDFIGENDVKHESYFKGLAIEKLWNDNNEYKIIHIDFSKLPDIQSSIEARLKDLNKTKDNKLDFITESFRLGFCAALIDHFKKYNLTINADILSPCDLIDDFATQSKNRSIVLLIDEYDYPLTHITDLNQDEHTLYENEVLRIMRKFYAAIKADDKYFRKVFITGITRYKDASIFTAGNTITDISLEPRFGAIVGFTRNEIKHYFYDYLRYATMQHFKIQEDEISDTYVEKLLDKLALWYDGYCFDRSYRYHVYSTISILKFFSQEDCAFSQYWYDLGGLPVILRSRVQQLAQSDTIEKLLQNKIIAIKKDNFISPSSYGSMRDEVLLYQCGYITLAKAFEGDRVFCKVANFELKSALASLNNSYLFQESKLNDITYSISYDLSAKQIHTLLSQILLAIDYHHFKYNNESSVVIMLLGYFLGEKLNAYSEDSNTKGRRDLRIDLDNNKTLIFEFKFNKKDSIIKDDELLDSALTQIKDRAYNQIINKQVRAFACVFNEEQRQISAFKELI